MNRLSSGIEALATLTNGFSSIKACSACALAEKVIETISCWKNEQIKSYINVICEALLLATGKTDNNLKCQFHNKLVFNWGLASINIINKGKERIVRLPRTIKMNDAIKYIALLNENKTIQTKLLHAYFQLIISDEQYEEQLYSLGMAYLEAKARGGEKSLLCPFAIFYSRGSITAIQGHIPETILRGYMRDWGMLENVDFNVNDVDFEEILGTENVNIGIKKRKYDFILPYNGNFSCKKIFIQCQFYAGDSGSVSHKVVDQTDSSRNATIQRFPNAVFVEYLDGAGYYASLNGDLRKMLLKPTTKTFFQIKTAPIKLRRELQNIHFLTLLDIEHAIVGSDGNCNRVRQLLLDEGYDCKDIEQTIDLFISMNLIHKNGDSLSVAEIRKPLIRRFCMLDTIANEGETQTDDNRNKGTLLIPGYSTLYGLLMSRITESVLSIKQAGQLWVSPQDAVDDIQWLIEKGFVKIY